MFADKKHSSVFLPPLYFYFWVFLIFNTTESHWGVCTIVNFVISISFNILKSPWATASHGVFLLFTVLHSDEELQWYFQTLPAPYWGSQGHSQHLPLVHCTRWLSAESNIVDLAFWFSHAQTRVRAGTHSYTDTHAEWEIIGSWLQQTDWVLASQTQTCLSVTRLEKIWLVGAHHRARNDGSEGGLVFKTHKLLFLSVWGHVVRFCEVPRWCNVCLPLPYPTLCLTLT